MKKIIILFACLALVEVVVAQSVGIGTSTPAAKLQINHRNTVTSPSLALHDSSAGTGSRILFSKESMGNNFSITSTIGLFAADNMLDFRTTVGSGLVLRGNGRVGINNSNPLATLHIGGGMKVADTMQVSGKGSFLNNLEVTRNIHADTLKPNAIRLTPNAGKNKILTSDSLGNASWTSSTSLTGGNLGYGSWGDCAIAQAISEFQPVTETPASFGDNLGYSVAMSGDFAIAGAYEYDPPVQDRGKVIFYKHNGERWEKFQTISMTTGNIPMFFGYAVSISGNFAVVGAYGDSSLAGSAFVYQYNGSNWVFMQKLIDQGTRLTGDQFGKSVAISGNHIFIGAPEEPTSGEPNRGGVHVFRFDGTSWNFITRITESSGNPGDRLGAAVAISGDEAVIGVPFADNSGQTDDGSALYYTFNGSSWVFVNKLDGSLSNDQFGSAVSISGDYSIIGAPNALSGQGVVRIAVKGSSSWGFSSIFDNTTFATGDRLGTSVAISGNYAMAGAIHGETSNNGNVIIYMNIGAGWQKLVRITDPGSFTNSDFGSSCGLDANSRRFIIGDNSFGSGFGKVLFGKIN